MNKIKVSALYLLVMTQQVMATSNSLVGLTLGLGQRQGNLLANIDNNSIIKDYRESGLVGGGLIGYQVTDTWTVGAELALELDVNAKTHQYSWLQGLSTTRYRRYPFTSLTGRIGYAIRPNLLPYARVGVEIGRDRLATELVTGQQSSLLIDRHWIHRFTLGAGFEVPLPSTCGITSRLEYNYHSKGGTLIAKGSSIDGASRAFFLQPHSQSVKLAIIWNFFNV